MCAARAREIYERDAKKRLDTKGGHSGPVNLPEAKGDARDLAGKAFGVSGKSVDHAKRVLDKGIPELALPLADSLNADHYATPQRIGNRYQRFHRRRSRAGIHAAKCRFTQPGLLGDRVTGRSRFVDDRPQQAAEVVSVLENNLSGIVWFAAHRA